MKKVVLILMIAFGFTTISNGQLRKVPGVVTEAFKTSFAGASNVEWKDNLTNFSANFTQNAATKTAKFNKEGVWLETVTVLSLNTLSKDVQDGFKKSKYADWTVKNVSLVEEAGKVPLYKLFVRKNDIEKRNLYFDKTGKLLSDNITI